MTQAEDHLRAGELGTADATAVLVVVGYIVAIAGVFAMCSGRWR